MIRGVAVLFCVFGFAFALLAEEPDPVKERLFAAKGAYIAEWQAVRKQTEKWLELREDAARKAGNFKLVDEIRAERAEFDDEGHLPRGAPAAIRGRHDKALKALEATYAQAVRDYTKAKKGDAATAAEVELRNIRSRLSGIDLLALIDPKAHAVLGEWKRDGKSVVGVNPRVPAVLQLPYEPGEEYDLEATARRLSGKEYFGLQVVAGGKRLGVAVDTWPTKGYLSGLGEINGKSLLDNGTALSGQFIKNNTDFTLLCSVRTEKIDVSVNGKVIISYKGDPNRFSIHSDFRVPNQKALAIQIGYTSPFKIDRLVVTPVKGRGAVTK